MGDKMAYRASGARILRAAVVAVVAAGVSALGPHSGSAGAQSIYDSRVQHRLELTAQQRPQVQRIVAETRRQAMAVFQKYGIDPNARPVFKQLFEASSELMAIERQERQAMRQILTPEQLAHYDRIIDDTRIRVRKAAQ